MNEQLAIEDAAVLDDEHVDVLLQAELGERVRAALGGDLPLADFFGRVGHEIGEGVVVGLGRLAAAQVAEREALLPVEALADVRIVVAAPAQEAAQDAERV